jgi:hypothetical protein
MVLNKFLKLTLLIVSIYIAICILLFFLLPPKYRYKDFIWWQVTLGVLKRPLTEVFMNGKTSLAYNWSKTDSQALTKSNELNLRSKNPRYRDYNNWSYKNVLSVFGKIEQTAIIKPYNYQGWWSVVFCISEQNICQESNLYFKGEVQILVDGDTTIWGRTSDGKIIDLKLLDYGKLGKNRNIPLV